MFAWSDYLSLARYLVQNAPQTGTQEAAQRSSVSRAYYAAYCLIRGWASGQAPDPFVPTRTGRDHGLLRTWLRGHREVHVAQELEQLHDWRKQCDYDDTLGVSLDIVCQEALDRIEQTLDTLAIIP